MTTQTETSGGEEPCLTSTRSSDWKNVTAEDIPPGWIDNMVKRLFDELNRQILRVENLQRQEDSKQPGTGAPKTKSDPEQPGDALKREQDSRTLARLQSSLTRLTKMEMERASLRTTKSARTRTEARIAIRRKVLAAIEREEAADRSGESQ